MKQLSAAILVVLITCLVALIAFEGLIRLSFKTEYENLAFLKNPSFTQIGSQMITGNFWVYRPRNTQHYPTHYLAGQSALTQRPTNTKKRIR
jgi:hypothetical protein